MTQRTGFLWSSWYTIREPIDLDHLVKQHIMTIIEIMTIFATIKIMKTIRVLRAPKPRNRLPVLLMI